MLVRCSGPSENSFVFGAPLGPRKQLLYRTDDVNRSGMPRDPYVVLGVSRKADPKTIRQRYRRRSLDLHPDRPGGDAAAFRELSDAFDILSDPAERKYFDLRGCSRAQEEASESAKSYRHRSE